jgi:hypothetical protein
MKIPVLHYINNHDQPFHINDIMKWLSEQGDKNALFKRKLISARLTDLIRTKVIRRMSRGTYIKIKKENTMKIYIIALCDTMGDHEMSIYKMEAENETQAGMQLLEKIVTRHDEIENFVYTIEELDNIIEI